MVRTLLGALASGRVGHAYLFAGPRGTGKTTIARIFAKALNCADFSKIREANLGQKSSIRDQQGRDLNIQNIPCNKCAACLAVNNGNSLDLIEIDGASNGRVDEIRELKGSATVAAMSGGYKTFLIDEVHMVSTSGFNALLKILEEPPAHVMFLLATTDPHKIPSTVLSRVQRFDFKKLTPKQIVAKLASIAKSEKIKIDDEALATIALSADGAIRDAEVMLTKVLSFVGEGEKITIERIQEILGLIPHTYHPQFFGYLVSRDRQAAMTFIQKLNDSGGNLEHFSRDFLAYLRTLLVAKVSPATLAAAGQDFSTAHIEQLSQLSASLDNQALIRMILLFTNARQEMKFSPIPQLPLELAVIELTNS